ncbi:MAG: DUF3880 domain-containing protein [Desulfovibrio sp.]|jgi:hypothetical protein|nr:DUF3880 domain-containing protein [Desulfovibrio sp.]
MSPAIRNGGDRVRLPDFSGRPVSLPDGPEAWVELTGPAGLPRKPDAPFLVLGLGPCPKTFPAVPPRGVFWLEAPGVLRRLSALRSDSLVPAGWRRISVRRALDLAPVCRVFAYRLNNRLAPLFWGPILGRLASLFASVAVSVGRKNGRARETALLPGTERQLLHQELKAALGASGLAALEMPLWAGPSVLPVWEEAIVRRRPALLLSVNGRGLDPEGAIFWLCRARNIPVAIWFVDNPWHVLPPLPWWKQAALFVTDASFIAPLRSLGGRCVRHLPLAVAPHMWRAGISEGCEPLFVGRSVFPEQKRFFAAARVPRELMARAETLAVAAADPSQGPNFHWWMEKLGLCPWPGHDARRAGLGAEACSRLRRARWIAAALPAGLAVVGDKGWEDMLPGLAVEPPLDYYTALPARYARSAALNVTSLLLPHSLSQRHFDVWAAGGALLTDATPGLDIFPSELTRPITLERPEDFGPRLAQLRADPATDALRTRWRELLRAEHGYERRVAVVRAVCGLG